MENGAEGGSSRRRRRVALQFRVGLPFCVAVPFVQPIGCAQEKLSRRGLLDEGACLPVGTRLKYPVSRFLHVRSPSSLSRASASVCVLAIKTSGRSVLPAARFCLWRRVMGRCGCLAFRARRNRTSSHVHGHLLEHKGWFAIGSRAPLVAGQAGVHVDRDV